MIYIKYIIAWTVGAVFTLFLFWILTTSGLTINEGLIEACQADLPRNQACKMIAVIDEEKS